MGPQFGLRFALRLKHDVAGYGTNQDGIWFGMSRSQIYLTNSGDGAGHYGTGYQLFNLANYDLFRAAGDVHIPVSPDFAWKIKAAPAILSLA